MPELPEVESIRRMLSNRLSGHRIIGVEVKLSRIVRRGTLEDVIGSEVTSVKRHGKWLEFILDRPISLYSHLRMTGAFLWSEDLNTGDDHVRVVFSFDHGWLLYRDVRTLGGFWVLDGEETPWHTLGPDPFSRKFNVSYLSDALSRRKIPIKVALLDQGLVAGIGNIYASETLYQAGIHPACPAQDLNKQELARLVKATRRMLKAAMDSGGTTFRDFRLSDGRDGEFRQFLKVYNRGEESCSDCGSEIMRITQAQRSTYFCPECQPSPKSGDSSDN